MKVSESSRYSEAEAGIKCNAVTFGVLVYAATALLLLVVVVFVHDENTVSTTSFLTAGFLSKPGEAQGPVRRESFSSQPANDRLTMDGGDANKSSAQNKSGSGGGLTAVDFEVHGRVQGVFFRKHTKDKARALGLTGWVRNTEAGTVSGQLQGDAKAVAAMKQWLCKTGSPQSRIEKCDFKNEISIDKKTFSGFEQRE